MQRQTHTRYHHQKMSSQTSKLYQILKENTNSDGLPIVDSHTFQSLNDEYGKEIFRETLAEFISIERPRYPLKTITEEKYTSKFLALRDSDPFRDVTAIKDLQKEVHEKYDDYKYDFKEYGLGVIDSKHTYNDASSFFQHDLRLACGSYGYKSPIEVFKTGTAKEIWSCLGPMWRGINGVSKQHIVNLDGSTEERLIGGEIAEKSYISAFRLGTYVATQFKPNVARSIYEMTKAKTVLDTSCGWGDRLCGFYTSSATEYYGCDPNPNTFERYKKQCIEYEKILTGVEPKVTEGYNLFTCEGSKKVEIYRCGAEDLPYSLLPPIDCAFTSPPYFSTERYNEGGEFEEDQSWAKFNEYEAWRDDFYLPVSQKSFDVLSDTGVLLVNILDPKINGTRYRSGDELVDMLRNNFLGQVGMRIMQRPQGKNVFSTEDGEFDQKALHEFFDKMYVENVWCFSKDTSIDLFESVKVSTLEAFF